VRRPPTTRTPPPSASYGAGAVFGNFIIHPSIHPTASRSRAKKEKKFSVERFFLTKYHSSI
jgi:hypothetical protein